MNTQSRNLNIVIYLVKSEHALNLKRYLLFLNRADDKYNNF